MMDRIFISAAALLGLSGVALSAYISHGLSDDALRSVAASAVLQQMLHALALLVLGVWIRIEAAGRLHLAAGGFFIAGVVSSGFIYLRVFGVTEALRDFVPAGGVFLMLGWLFLGLAAWRRKA
jgi:uncharacterized membrane protein YgdD (TMEM256/DUF423 family)